MGSQAQANLKGSPRLGNYLRKLRAGYGYSLRRVEERARAEGGEIDNSQLSRYEKGICYPSFDKLRVLASVFNVSVQSFSDVVDLEVYEELKPATDDVEELTGMGVAALKGGDSGTAFACFERAIELLLEAPPDSGRDELLGRARVEQAAALTRLGKLALAEQELRHALRGYERLSPRLRARALLALANIHADQGDAFLGEMEAERAYEVARAESLDRFAAMALHTRARVLSARGCWAEAIGLYRQAVRIYTECGDDYEAIRVRNNIGSCYSALGKMGQSMRMLRETLAEARGKGYRRLHAMAWSNLGEAYYLQSDSRRAHGCFRESDALAMYNDEKHPDLLFRNAYYSWRMAITEDNPTREKIAFGRLKALRSDLERRFAEVEAFDAYVERGRCHA
jgi:tetratricopeptide (TPR) repeat protein